MDPNGNSDPWDASSSPAPQDANNSPDPLIQVQHLDHAFLEGGMAKQVLHDINLTVHAGEIVILTGPSGSGKTTLLTMLGGLRAAQSGSLQILGVELLHAERRVLTQLRRQAGFIFQAHNPCCPISPPWPMCAWD
jgi:putative ABC transport system ATP-binding protein